MLYIDGGSFVIKIIMYIVLVATTVKFFKMTQSIKEVGRLTKKLIIFGNIYAVLILVSNVLTLLYIFRGLDD